MRILFGSVIGAAVLFCWGFVYWTIMPYSQKVIKPLPDETGVVAALQASQTEAGVYRVPGPPLSTEKEDMDAYGASYGEGPLAMIMYRPQGEPFMDWKYFAFGYLQMFLAAFAAAIALSASDIPIYPGRVMIVFWMGVFAALWGRLGDVAWFRYPMDHFWLSFAYTVSSGLILGLVLAAFVRPPVQPEQ